MTQLTNIPLENAYETNLSGSISASATSIVVDTAPSFTLPAGQTVDAVIDPENSKRERVKITAISGSTLTVTRGEPDYLGDSGTAVGHSGGATFVITDSWSIFNDIGTAVNSKVDKATGELEVYADATARDAAITSPSNGMQCYQTDTGKFYDYTAGSWVARESGGTFPNMSTTVAGKGEKGTAAEVLAGTAVGGTGAPNVVTADILQDSGVSVDTSAGAGDAGKLAKLDSGGGLKANMLNLDSESLEDDGSDNLQVKLDPSGGISKGANGLATRTDDIYTTDYVYGETITTGDVLYQKQSDGRVYKITSDSKTWGSIVGVADEAGSAADTGKRIKQKGAVAGSFSAIQPTFEQTTSSSTRRVGELSGSSRYAVAAPIDNSGGPECVISGDLVVNIGHLNPSYDLEVKIVRGDANGPYFGYTSAGAGTQAIGDVLFSYSIASASVPSTMTDYTITVTDTTIPANSVFWLVFYSRIATAGSQYWNVRCDASTDGLFLDSGASPSWYASAAPYHTFTVSSVNPWDSRYAVRAYGDGADGGFGIGTSSSCDGFERPIGHVMSATEWYLDLTEKKVFATATSMNFNTSAFTPETTSLDFRPYSFKGASDGGYFISNTEMSQGLAGGIGPVIYENGVVWTCKGTTGNWTTLSATDNLYFEATS